MIYLKRVGYNVEHSDGLTIDRPNGSGDYLFILFRSRMELRFDDKPTQFADKNHYIIYGSGSRHDYRDAEKPMIHDWFHFDGERLDRFFEELHLPLDTLLPAPDPFYISRKVQELHVEHIDTGKFRDEIIDSTIRCLLLKLSAIRNRVGSNMQSGKYYGEIVKLRNEIYQTPQIFYSIEELAAKVNLSRSYFQRIYTELFGISVHNDMINNRIQYAMYLLENTTYGIAEIAHLCGYENDVHFMRQFKKKADMTPSQYRSNHHFDIDRV
ncbi:helix-turn-helix domain-containing protein [Paenibacillus arenilitoris]|uniref:Helix-turn-helix transcriptional regulator n=1 Tax=Paenibacillus arenilitoris TaxID=2772299 RepID=A0A927CK51_9BACL|nr:AraC family transcriptional regulator [Paenibacillus arenilitoris]MBD2867160.1 helix-turn-helix transcriptional regulator [Paenibacillus arenilitoris]